MSEVVIRPTLKFIKLGYLVALMLVLVVAGLVGYYQLSPYLAGAGALLFLWPAARHVRRQLTKLSIMGDKMRYEMGALSKTTRTIQLSKVQDVSVHQGLAQRMFGVGDLSIETAGETSRLTISDIDRPQFVADQIIEIAHKGPVQGQQA